MRRNLHVPGAACVAALLWLGVPAAAQEWELERDALLGQTVAELEVLAELSQGQRLYAERDRLYAAIRRLDPKHAEARRYLKLRRRPDGTWQQAKSYHSPRNWGAETEELAQLEAVVVGGYRQALDALVAEHGIDTEERFTLLLHVVPDDAQARAFRGEAWLPYTASARSRQSAGRWVLEETASALEWREARGEGFRQLLEKRPDVEVDPTGADEPVFSSSWKASLATPHVRVRAMLPEAQAVEYVRSGELAVEVFALVFGEAPRLESDITLYVLDRRPVHEALGRQLNIGADRVSAFRSGWMPETSNLAICVGRHDERVDHVVRQCFQRMLAESFGIDERQGWAFEGMGTLLTVLQTGRSAMVHAPLDPEVAVRGSAEELWARAVEVVLAPDLDLEVTLAKPVTELTRRDVLSAHAFSRYLVEGHAPDVVRLLSDLSDRPPAQVFEQVLGRDTDELQRRLVRWVREVDDLWASSRPGR